MVSLSETSVMLPPRVSETLPRVALMALIWFCMAYRLLDRVPMALWVVAFMFCRESFMPDRLLLRPFLAAWMVSGSGREGSSGSGISSPTAFLAS